MILIKKKDMIKIPDMFKKISEYDVYRYYMPRSFSLGEMIESPFIKQRSPSFGIYQKDNRIYHRDFDPEQDEYHGDCIAFVRQLYSLSTEAAVEKIAQDFGLLDGSNRYESIKQQYVAPVLEEKRYKLIQVDSKDWDTAALQYWAQYGISKDQLHRERIYNVKSWCINRRPQKIDKGELCFAYWFPNGFKIYYPHRDGKWKWITNIGKIVENTKVIDTCDKIVISKSRKDRMTLSNIFPQLGIISLQNESAASYTEDVIEKLKNKIVYISFDSDPAGVKASLDMQKKYPWMHYVNVPRWFWEERFLKDWADIYAEYGSEVIIEQFKQKQIV
jgi:hypothetical protein